jgi:transposase
MSIAKRKELWSQRIQDFRNSGQTQANWVIQGAQTWLSTLYNRMHVHLKKESVLHGDKTTLQVLAEPGRSATSTSYMWLYRTAEKPAIVLYDYQQTRAHKHPKAFLQGFQGYLHVWMVMPDIMGYQVLHW